MASEAVKVVVRSRPINEREERLDCEVVVVMEQSIAQVQLKKPKSDAPPKLFTFDGAYFMHDTTQQMYDEICVPLVEAALDGYNGTVFAYGQTGCGKSYTMMGVEHPMANKGIIPRAFEHIFEHVAIADERKYLIRATYLEIYNEEVRDLLGRDVKKRLELHEHPDKGVYVQGLSMHKVHNVHDLQRVMELGGKNRSVGATLMNVDSSRSHSIFSIELEMIDTSGEGVRAGKLNLVDLAGSERQSKTGSTGDRLKEATKINLSLSALGNVISALVDGRAKHIPYRDSKLTRLLQSSLGGNTKTLMVACISPADNNYEETLSTLRYANRAKNIKNKPRINEDPKDAMLREYQEEIKKLKALLSGQVEHTATDSKAPPSYHPAALDWEAEREAIRREYEERLASLQEQYGRQQADKEQLQQDLEMLKLERDSQLAALAQDRFTDAQGPQSASSDTQENYGAATTSDQQILQQHEDALQRLEELQKEMIGGEQAGDDDLRQRLDDRKHKAEEHTVTLYKSVDLMDDDGIIEGIFNSITDEVRVKTELLEKAQLKLRSAEEEIKDLSTEFEFDRQDYLDTIRKQQVTIKLQEQLLDTVVPMLRRDCNYYNVDKIKNECVWDGDKFQWILPKVVTSKTTIAPTNSKSALRLPQGLNKLTSSPELQEKHVASGNEGMDDHRRQQLKTVEPDYFKPKRALELLGQKGNSSSDSMMESHKGVSASSFVPNAATVHGIENLLLSDPSCARRPTKLQSLPVNPSSLKSLPNTLTPLPPAPRSQSNLLGSVETKKTRKRKSLDPIPDKHKTSPFM